MRPHTTKRVLGGLGLIVVVACLWYYLAPTALGGSTSYVVTRGVSMEPRFHTGDLVLVRSQSSYRVGQIVAYHSNVFHTVVLHRIIGRIGNSYVFKGDNNNFVDFEHPTQSQLIGSVWVHVPGVGATLDAIRSPALAGVLIAIAALLFGGAAFTRSRRRRGRERRAGAGLEPSAAVLARPTAPVALVLAIGLVALLPFVMLALVAFTRPATAQLPSSVPYRQSGRLSYEAQATPGPTYEGDRAVTGEPLFTHVIETVKLQFSYRFHSSTPHSLSGTATLAAALASTSGWRTMLPLGSPQHFQGDHGVVSANLHMASLLGLVRSVEKATDASGAYTLALLPQVSAHGTLGGAPLHTTFTPAVRFSLNEVELQPLLPTGGAVTPGHSTTALFGPTAGGSLAVTRNQAQYISVRFAQVSVASARAIALAGIALVLCAIAVGLALVWPRRRDETQLILSRYGRMIVPVERVGQLPGVPVIDVADIDALVRIAEHYERSILQETADGADAFWVSDESGQFRYAPRAPEWTTEGVWGESARVQPRPANPRTEELERVFGTPSTALPEAEPAAVPFDGSSEAAQPPAWPQPDAEPAAVRPDWPCDDAQSQVWPGPATTFNVAPLPRAEQPVAYAGASSAVAHEAWTQPPVAEPVPEGEPEDWRAACEAAGVVLNAPTFP
jgi:signal peptidase I